MQDYITLSHALTKLFHPLVEVVIHNLETEKIVHISGSLSQRKAGDDSLIHKQKLLDEDYLDSIVYEKLGVRGTPMKSVSILLPSSQHPQYMMCINVDISMFEQIKSISEMFMGNTSPKPASLFKNDWQEKLHQGMFDFITEKSWSLTQLTTKQKKDIVRYLFEEGAFEQKKAADYIAEALNLNRSTIFNYLKEWRAL